MMCIPRSCDYNVNVRHVQPPGPWASPVPPSVRIFPYTFTEMHELLRMKNAELRIWKHPAPPLFMHVVQCIAINIRKRLEKYGIY